MKFEQKMKRVLKDHYVVMIHDEGCWLLTRRIKTATIKIDGFERKWNFPPAFIDMMDPFHVSLRQFERVYGSYFEFFFASPSPPLANSSLFFAARSDRLPKAAQFDFGVCVREYIQEGLFKKLTLAPNAYRSPATSLKPEFSAADSCAFPVRRPLAATCPRRLRSSPGHTF